MKIFRNKTDYDGTVVALGNFDGLHIAHMTINRNGIKYDTVSAWKCLLGSWNYIGNCINELDSGITCSCTCLHISIDQFKNCKNEISV